MNIFTHTWTNDVQNHFNINVDLSFGTREASCNCQERSDNIQSALRDCCEVWMSKRLFTTKTILQTLNVPPCSAGLDLFSHLLKETVKFPIEKQYHRVIEILFWCSLSQSGTIFPVRFEWLYASLNFPIVQQMYFQLVWNSCLFLTLHTYFWSFAPVTTILGRQHYGTKWKRSI